MVSPVVEILLGPITLLWAISAAVSGASSNGLKLFVTALAGGFGTILYAVIGGLALSLTR